MDYKKIRRERRFKILSFDYSEVLDLLIVLPNQNMRIKRIKLPSEYFIDGVYYEPSGRCFNYVIGSEKFPSISVGAQISICNDEIDYSIIHFDRDKDFKVVGF